MDSTVYDREHKKLGIVSDVVFEAENGLLAFVRITLDDQHTVVVPYDAIEIDLDTHCLCVKMYRQTVGKFTDRDAP
jgi:ribosomal 30S subunit maturation factor RimM